MKNFRERFGEALEPRTLLAANPIISEFQTNNVETVTDGHGFHSNWIEVSNPSDEPINLRDWHLTDSSETLAKWSFPSVEIAPNAALIVFASGYPASAEEELATNFKLDNSDSYLALVHPGGVTVEQEFRDFPKQLADVSFGVFNNDLDAPVFFHTPTPGSANGPTAAPTPRIKTESGVFVDELEIITASDAGMEVRYTLDGSTPTVESNLYTGPFVLNSSAMIHAVAFDPTGDSKLEPSTPAAANFIAVSSSLADDNVRYIVLVECK
ncbi:MAG: chitobiase/beta-hexosaminidase C-terminal domain-containing protein [Planctomycetales bacterium]|nr:chitobiase/beta-hexosaminidase C-terminal domain-containing protein [Planctomycetales bacterium]